jgi:hypothetical protein
LIVADTKHLGAVIVAGEADGDGMSYVIRLSLADDRKASYEKSIGFNEFL